MVQSNLLPQQILVECTQMIQGEQAAFACAISRNTHAAGGFAYGVSTGQKKMKILTCPGCFL
jgi:hypothetical protein